MLKNTLLISFLILQLTVACRKDKSTMSALELIHTYSLDITEPSGLSTDLNGTVLFTVSDHDNKVYKMTTSGEILQVFSFTGNDLEGVTRFTSNKLLLAEERTKNIIEYNIFTDGYTTHHIAYENEEINSGMEGITYNPDTQKIYFLNEKKPGKLFVLNNSFTITDTYDLDFSNDYSGICYEQQSNSLWIVSDESQSVSNCTCNGDLIKSYRINVHKPEGISIIDDKIYIVSDSQEKLYLFQKPE